MSDEQQAAPTEVSEQKIMCFVSKKMVPMSETVEVEYMPHKKVNVLPKYIKYESAEK